MTAHASGRFFGFVIGGLLQLLTEPARYCTVTATHNGPYRPEACVLSVVLHMMLFNRVRDGKLAQTWAIVEGPGFDEQLTGETAPEQLHNTG